VRGLPLFVLLLLAAAAPAQATIVFPNAGFETGDATGWTSDLGTVQVTQSAAGLSAPSGQYFALLTPDSPGCNAVDLAHNFSGNAGDTLTGYVSSPGDSFGFLVVEIDPPGGVPQDIYRNFLSSPLDWQQWTYTLPSDGTYGFGETGSGCTSPQRQFGLDIVQPAGPSAPGAPSVSKLINHGAFSLSWAAPSGGDVSSYRVERRDANDTAAAWQPVASGITTTSLTIDSSSPEPEGQWVYHVIASNGNGDSAPSKISKTVYVDRTAPPAPTLSIAGGQTKYTGSDGQRWFLNSEIVDVTGNGDLPTDGSGLAAFPATFTVTKNGDQTVSKTVKDRAANVSDPGTLEVRVDSQKPTLTMACGNSTVEQGADRSVAWSATDNGSGINGDPSGSNQIDTTTPGTIPVTQTVTDNVGHSTTKTCNYTVK
jgi:hypothetical protein